MPRSIRYGYFSLSKQIPAHLMDVIGVFKKHDLSIWSENLESNDVLSIVRNSLLDLGFFVEFGKKDDEKIIFPLLTDNEGYILKEYQPDAYNEGTKTILEIENSATFIKNAFFKHLFNGCVNPKANYLVMAVRNRHRNKRNDFENACKHLEILYGSRLKIPLKGILIVGYGDSAR